MNYYDFAISLVREAGERLKKINANSIKVSHKGGVEKDVVTNVDLEINKFITDRIKENFPEHGIYSEEGEGKDTNSDYEWSIDPIDGSANFGRGIPHFACCLALFNKGVLELGIVYNPMTDELFSFEKGKGPLLNGHPISVSGVSKAKEAQGIIIVGHQPSYWDWGAATYRSFLEHLKKLKAFGSSALDLCFLAAGRADVVVYGTLTTQDVAGAIGILRAAGGEIYTPEGEPVQYSKTRQTIIATSNRELFDEVIQHIHTNLLPPKSSS